MFSFELDFLKSHCIIFNEDCNLTLNKLFNSNIKIDLVLTSPPYNTSRNLISQKARDTHEGRYDIPFEDMTNDEYIIWTRNIFNRIEKVLAINGVVLWNLSYGSENTECMIRCINDLLVNTNFTLADIIIWKKKTALSNNVSFNKLTRIIELIYVLCRKNEFKTFFCNKECLSIRKDNGQKIYKNVYNFIEAANNDEPCPYNKATYSSDLCCKLLDIYAKEGSLVYDCFNGTGTTALACAKMNMNYIGSEISEKQCEWSKRRLLKYLKYQESIPSFFISKKAKEESKIISSFQNLK